MKIKESFGVKAFRAFDYALITLLVLICLYPFWHVLMASFSDPRKIVAYTGALLKPLGFSLEAYQSVLSDIRVYTGFGNTLLHLMMGVPLSLVVTILGAYFMSRKGMLFKRPIILYCLFTMYISGGLIPFYLNLKNLGLTGHRWSVILPFCLSTYNMIIMRTAFDSVPESLSDAARIDGAGHMTIMFKVMLPVCKATVAVITMYYGMNIWNRWFWENLLLDSDMKWPIQAVLRSFLLDENDSGMVDVFEAATTKYAIIIVAIFPVLIIYPMLQKYFTKGVMIGSVKG